jgi:hypothetical protein
MAAWKYYTPYQSDLHAEQAISPQPSLQLSLYLFSPLYFKFLFLKKVVTNQYKAVIYSDLQRYKFVTKKTGFVTSPVTRLKSIYPMLQLCNSLINILLTLIYPPLKSCYKRPVTYKILEIIILRVKYSELLFYKVVTCNILENIVLQALLQTLFLLLQSCNTVTCFAAICYSGLLQLCPKIGKNNLDASGKFTYPNCLQKSCYKRLVTYKILEIIILRVKYSELLFYKVVTCNILKNIVLQALLQTLFLLLQSCNTVTCFASIRYSGLLQLCPKIGKNNLDASRKFIIYNS